VVCRRCISRTNVDFDDDAVRAVMDRYHLATNREAVNFALRTLAGEALSIDDARRLRGSGWDGDPDPVPTFTSFTMTTRLTWSRGVW